MGWGFPPKYEVSKKTSASIDDTKNELIKAAEEFKWKLVQNSGYIVEFYRPQTSFFKKYIYITGGWTILVRITESGDVHLSSRLDNVLHDRGSNQKNIENLLEKVNLT
jgi:hypothetical protein